MFTKGAKRKANRVLGKLTILVYNGNWEGGEHSFWREDMVLAQNNILEGIWILSLRSGPSCSGSLPCFKMSGQHLGLVNF
jgi:hypothetical protein